MTTEISVEQLSKIKLQCNKRFYFQQDGAAPHTARLVQDWFKLKLAI